MAGESYTIDCSEGYSVLNGSDTMECNENGTLSTAPTCIGWCYIYR